MKKLAIIYTILVVSFSAIYAQPFTDIATFNAQKLNTKYSNGIGTNLTSNYFAGLLLPLKINAKNTIIVRLNTEELVSKNTAYDIKERSLYALTFGIGAQHYFGKKLSAVFLFIPKIATDFEKKLNQYDKQYGGTVLLQYKFGKHFRAKAGMYYNKEPFGNFFVPLLGIDWQISPRWMIYGTFPLMNRLEFKISNHFYTGVGSRVYGRSYRLSSYLNSDYIWNQENQVKYFLDYYITKKLVCYAELGRTFGYGPKQIMFNKSRDNVVLNHPIYQPINQGIFVNVGVAIRIRTGI